MGKSHGLDASEVELVSLRNILSIEPTAPYPEFGRRLLEGSAVRQRVLANLHVRMEDVVTSFGI